MERIFTVLLLLVVSVNILYACSEVDKVVNTWVGGRKGFLLVSAKDNDKVTIHFSGPLTKAEFFCLTFVSGNELSSTYTLKKWCPNEKGVRTFGYALYYKGSKRKHRVEFSKIEVNGVMYCNDTFTNKKEEGQNSTCGALVKVDHTGSGYQDGTITIPVAKALNTWKFVVGFDRNVTGFNVNEAQPDLAVKEPCQKFNTHKCYDFNAKLPAGKFTFKYYLAFIQARGVPKIVYANLYDDKNSSGCGVKPKCP